MTDETLDQEQLRRLAERTAQLPREIEPPTDAWAGIKAAIESPVPMAQPSIHTTFWQRPAFLAAAALLLVAGSSLITATLLGDRRTAPAEHRVAVEPAGEPTAPEPRPAIDSPARVAAPAPEVARLDSRPSGTPASLAEFTMMENDYISSANRLSAILESDQVRFTPRTIAKLKESIRIIDAAILEARRALAEDPANKQLIEMLSNSYNQKIDLLRRSTEMGRS